MKKINWKDILWSTLLTILGVICFPANPLVLSGVLDVKSYLPLTVIGFIIWAFGMVLVMAPIVIFPRRGGVKKKKSVVSTTLLVDTGIYALVRHPQYTGGIYAIFITTFLLYPHWLFAILGILGIVVIALGIKEEDKRLVEKFGNDYVSYIKRVPGMNIFKGIIKAIKK